MSRRTQHPAFREEPRIHEELGLYGDALTVAELTEVVHKLLDHLNLKLIRTNCTKHGDTQLIIEPEEDPDAL